MFFKSHTRKQCTIYQHTNYHNTTNCLNYFSHIIYAHFKLTCTRIFKKKKKTTFDSHLYNTANYQRFEIENFFHMSYSPKLCIHLTHHTDLTRHYLTTEQVHHCLTFVIYQEMVLLVWLECKLNSLNLKLSFVVGFCAKLVKSAVLTSSFESNWNLSHHFMIAFISKVK